MDVVASLPAFVLAVVLIAATPGPAMALILRRAAVRGFRGCVPTVLGIEAGLYVWALLAGAGFAALVAASQTAYLVLRVVGAGVLVYLGGRALWAAWTMRGAAGAAAPAPPPLTRRGAWAGVAEGLAVQLANPKAAVFMLAFYPQFVPPDRRLPPTSPGASAARGPLGDGAARPRSARRRRRLRGAAHEALTTGRSGSAARTGRRHRRARPVSSR